MYKAFRTNTDEISKLESYVESTDIDKLKSLQKDFKQEIRPFILPKDGVINGETLKDTYFPTSKNGKPYDIFISHSHNNQKEAEILAAWLTKYKGLSCFVDSFVWGSADELLKEIDNKYCKDYRKNTYDYTKRNFTTSHVHAILSMSLLEIINESSYCIFIESSESLNLECLGKKKTFSPWLYEEIEYMKILVPKEAKLKLFCKAVTESKDLTVKYEVSELDNFSFLRYDDFLHIRCMTQTL